VSAYILCWLSFCPFLVLSDGREETIMIQIRAGQAHSTNWLPKVANSQQP
jgi:hypothetical protein